MLSNDLANLYRHKYANLSQALAYEFVDISSDTVKIYTNQLDYLSDEIVLFAELISPDLIKISDAGIMTYNYQCLLVDDFIERQSLTSNRAINNLIKKSQALFTFDDELVIHAKHCHFADKLDNLINLIDKINHYFVTSMAID